MSTGTNVCAKCNYDRLHIDKVLGNLKYNDNNKKQERTTFVALENPFRIQKYL